MKIEVLKRIFEEALRKVNINPPEEKVFAKWTEDKEIWRAIACQKNDCILGKFLVYKEPILHEFTHNIIKTMLQYINGAMQHGEGGHSQRANLEMIDIPELAWSLFHDELSATSKYKITRCLECKTADAKYEEAVGSAEESLRNIKILLTI